MPTTKQILTEAKALIADPAHWTQGDFALSSEGKGVAGYDPDACKWCSIGALYKALSSLNGSPGQRYSAGRAAEVLLNTAACTLDADARSAIAFNDEHDHAQVMQMWDKAIEAAP